MLNKCSPIVAYILFILISIITIINTNEISDPRYAANPINRCFFCKENLYKTIKAYTEGNIFSGANIDDLSDYRPGLDAAKEANVDHPFILAKIGKKLSKIVKNCLKLLKFV